MTLLFWPVIKMEDFDFSDDEISSEVIETISSVQD